MHHPTVIDFSRPFELASELFGLKQGRGRGRRVMRPRACRVAGVALRSSHVLGNHPSAGASGVASHRVALRLLTQHRDDRHYHPNHPIHIVDTWRSRSFACRTQRSGWQSFAVTLRVETPQHAHRAGRRQTFAFVRTYHAPPWLPRSAGCRAGTSADRKTSAHGSSIPMRTWAPVSSSRARRPLPHRKLPCRVGMPPV